ncbi:hypothetical protein SELMODRAFT_96597 [Selaginella moellendorffii]|uniref:EF-hand domain-containing protein n=1 Tax=Selaginella moellendorffii TaxID=88036 RepID=D8RL53_SELML|nr:hypothetical protein SELMODRAFT_96597 [Selaginella moellendorffii]
MAAPIDQAELRRAFDMFDSNRDGMISRQELREIGDKLGMRWSDEETSSMLESVDENGDGLVDFGEFNALYSQHIQGEEIQAAEEARIKAELQEAFEVFDKNKDGFITALELHSVLCSLGLKHGSDMVHVKNMISSVDADGDHKVNFKEFRTMMSKALAM